MKTWTKKSSSRGRTVANWSPVIVLPFFLKKISHFPVNPFKLHGLSRPELEKINKRKKIGMSVSQPPNETRFPLFEMILNFLCGLFNSEGDASLNY